MTRTYHSNRLLLGATGALDPDFLRRRGPLGLGWTFHYGVVWPVLNQQTQTLDYELVHGDGNREAFYPNDMSSGEVTDLQDVAPQGATPYVSKSLSVLCLDPSSQDGSSSIVPTASRSRWSALPRSWLPRATVRGRSTSAGR
jgi:hypothetical protein